MVEFTPIQTFYGPMATVMFILLISFCLMVCAIIIYLRREDTAYHSTHKQIKDARSDNIDFNRALNLKLDNQKTEFTKYIDNLHKLLVDRFDHVKGESKAYTDNVSLKNVAIAENVEDNLNYKIKELEMHISQLRKDIIKTKVIEEVKKAVKSKPLKRKTPKRRVL